ncbi:hypothetical protein KXS08_09660, partial [Acinetobacter radioresistens]
MAIQEINVSTGPNTGNGDPIRAAFVKINQNFSNQQHAASRMVGTQAGNVMQVGAFGLGLTADTPYISPTTDLLNLPNGLYGLENGGHSGILVRQATNTGLTRMGVFGFPSDSTTSAPFYYRLNLANGTTLQQSQAYRHTFYTTQNTTVDSNGYIKAASPIANLFNDHIELN